MGHGRSRGRTPAYALTRAIVVLLVAAAVYPHVVPVRHTVRSRLGLLAVTRPGIKQFDFKPTAAAQQKAASSGLAALVAAAKKNPDATGAYSVEWTTSGTVKGTKDLAGVIVFLLPDPADAKKVLAQVVSRQLSPGAYPSLKRTATFALRGVPGSTGSNYQLIKATSTSQSLSLAAFRDADVVVVAEAIKGAGTQGDTETAALTEYRHLQTVASGFSLTVVHHPKVATIVWSVGAVFLALVAALGPVLVGRSRRRRRQQRQEELDRLIVVRGQTITKRRRVADS